MRTRGVFAAGCAALHLSALPAAAENAWRFEVEYSDPAGVINSLDDTARVTLWAGFDENLYAFAGGVLSVNGDDPRDAGVWSFIERLLKGPGTRDGLAGGGWVTDIITGQLHFPSANIFADTSNPIEAWTAVWQTEDLAPRTVMLGTFTSKFDIYTNDAGVSDQFIDTLMEGIGEIRVVPAPAGAGVLVALAGLFVPRRRG